MTKHTLHASSCLSANMVRGNSAQTSRLHSLSILASYEAKTAKISNLWTFWPIIQLTSHHHFPTPSLPLTIVIIIDVNDDDSGRPLGSKLNSTLINVN